MIVAILVQRKVRHTSCRTVYGSNYIASIEMCNTSMLVGKDHTTTLSTLVVITHGDEEHVVMPGSRIKVDEQSMMM
jgi:hypothetical protein